MPARISRQYLSDDSLGRAIKMISAQVSNIGTLTHRYRDEPEVTYYLAPCRRPRGGVMSRPRMRCAQCGGPVARHHAGQFTGPVTFVCVAHPEHDAIGRWVKHVNGNPRDNSVENVELVDPGVSVAAIAQAAELLGVADGDIYALVHGLLIHREVAEKEKRAFAAQQLRDAAYEASIGGCDVRRLRALADELDS